MTELDTSSSPLDTKMSSNYLWCLKVELQPLSELLIRQVGKSNVQWFTYPFIPPTTFSGFLANLVTDSNKKFIEINDNEIRQLQDIDLYSNLIPLGAYEPIVYGKIKESKRHYRQHLGASFNYEGCAQLSERGTGKKIAIVNYLITQKLHGLIVAHYDNENRIMLEKLKEKIIYKFGKIGKKGALYIKSSSEPFKCELTKKEVTLIPSTLVPLEVTCELNNHYIAPIKIERHDKGFNWRCYPVTIGVTAHDKFYENIKEEINIPQTLVSFFKNNVLH